MTWHVKGKSGNSCLLVNASSGIVLYEPDQPRDSKVLLTSDQTLQHPRHGGRWSSATTNCRGLAYTSTIAPELEGEAEAIRLSTKELKRQYNKKNNEAQALQRALSLSRGEASKEKEEEEATIQRVVSLSMLDNKQEMEDEECYQRVIDLSRQEFNAEECAEAAFHRALEMSQQEHERCQMKTVTTEDELMRQAMNLSMMEYQAEKVGEVLLLQSVDPARKGGLDFDAQEEA
jgi:hypothetical protein